MGDKKLLIFTFILSTMFYNFKPERGIFMLMDVCITCGDELSKMERNRCECWECIDKAIETYGEDFLDE